MNKIYGIFNGFYSDWNVFGYFTDDDLVRKYYGKTTVKTEKKVTINL